VAPQSYQAHMLKGLVEARMIHLSDAESTYARAVDLNPKAPEALLALALVESANEKRRQSQNTFERAIRKFPRHGVIYQEYARMLLKFSAGSDPEARAKAVSLLQSALAFDGSLAESHYQLGKLALDDGDLPLATSHLETAVHLRPAGSRIHFALARAYKRAGRSEQASKELASFQRLKSQEEKSPDEVITKGNSRDPGSGATGNPRESKPGASMKTYIRKYKPFLPLVRAFSWRLEPTILESLQGGREFIMIPGWTA